MPGFTGRQRHGLACRTLTAVVILLGAGRVGSATMEPGKQAARNPTTNADPLDERRQELLDYMTNNYRRLLRSRDWMTRSVTVISLAKLPTGEVTAILFDRLEKEDHPVAKLVAWQAILARAPMLDYRQFKEWEKLTWKMVNQNLFHGDLRIGLLEMLGSAPLTPQGRTWFSNLFGQTSSLDSADIPTLIAMGRAVRSWAREDLVTALISQLRTPDAAVRAELILQAAGADIPLNRTSGAPNAYAEWWRKNKQAFTADPPGADGYKKLLPQFIAAPATFQQVNPRDPEWNKDLELGDLGLGMFDFGISIDCSGSMGPELERLKRDMQVIFEAFAQVAHRPRISLTLFTVGGRVEHMPLTGDRSQLTAAVSKVKVMHGLKPGGPIDEEWAGSLEKAIAASKWGPANERNKRLIVLISDEPIVPLQAERCLKIAEEADKQGFRIYGVKVLSAAGGSDNPLDAPFDRTATAPNFQPKGKGWDVYDRIAELTNARAIAVQVPQGAFGLGAPPTGKKENPAAIAPIYPGGGPTSMILTMVLTDAINPQYADRVEPLVKILVAYCQKEAARIPEKRNPTKPTAK